MNNEQFLALGVALPTRSQPCGPRPGVRVQRWFDLFGYDSDAAYTFTRCIHDRASNAFDPRYTRCPICEHVWLANSNDLTPSALPPAHCVTCYNVAKRAGQEPPSEPAWALEICQHCGVYVCVRHIQYGSSEEYLCVQCRRAQVAQERAAATKPEQAVGLSITVSVA